jgi:ParB family chromosome partitioning protein
MSKRRPDINLGRTAQPRVGDFEQLFTSEADPEQAAGLTLKSIRLDAIERDPAQPRTTFPPESLAELALSIQQNGLIHPFEVVQVGRARYRIVHGERRWRAAQIAGLEAIPAIIQRRDYDDVTRYARQLVENIQREDLNDVDRAEGLVHLQVLLQQELNAEASAAGKKPWSSKASWAKVGERLGNSRQRVHQLVKLLELPEEIKDAVRQGILSERETRIYHQVAADHQVALHQARLQHRLNGDSVREIVRFLADNPQANVALALGHIATTTPATSNTQVVEQLQRALTQLQLEGLDSAERRLTLQQLESLKQQVARAIHNLRRDATGQANT